MLYIRIGCVYLDPSVCLDAKKSWRQIEREPENTDLKGSDAFFSFIIIVNAQLPIGPKRSLLKADAGWEQRVTETLLLHSCRLQTK